MDPDIQANLKWELQVVELAEEKFPQIEQLYEAHRQIDLPLAMMKIKQERNMAIHMPKCKLEDLGGYGPLSEDEINGNLPLINQSAWQTAFLHLHTKSILEYAAAPRDRRIDPTYCPVVRQYSWAQYDTISKYYPEPQNFPLLPPADRFCTEKYFLSSLFHAITLYKGVSDIACRLLSKFAHTLILCIEVFDPIISHGRSC